MSKKQEREGGLENFHPITVKKKVQIREESEESTERKEPQLNQIRYRKRHPINQNYLSFLEQKKRESMESSLYSEAEEQDKLIHNIRKKIKQERIRSLSINHVSERKAIKDAHLREMRVFQQAWRYQFERQKVEEAHRVAEFEKRRQLQISKARCEVMRRCKSAKASTKLMEVRDLEAYERKLKKFCRYKQLKQVRSEKKKKKKEYHDETQKIYKKIAEQEERKLTMRQTKRYNSFMARISQSKREAEIRYRRDERRLKQKYENICKNLVHEQKVEMNELLSTIEK